MARTGDVNRDGWAGLRGCEGRSSLPRLAHKQIPWSRVGTHKWVRDVTTDRSQGPAGRAPPVALQTVWVSGWLRIQEVP